MRRQRRRVRHHAVPDGRPEPGHRPRHRSGAGPDAARHDDRVRRQPHRDPRRVRRAGVRHRHERGRARAGHPDAAAVAPEVDGDRRRRRRATGRDGQGHHPRDHRRDRHRRRHRPRHRVPRPGDRGVVDGRSDDGVQHVDRGRARAPASSRPTTRRSPTSKAAPTPPRARRGRPPSTTGGRSHSDADAVWDKQVTIDASALTPHVTWGTNPGQVASIDARIPSPDDVHRPAARESVERALDVHGSPAGHADPRDRRRHGVHRLVHEQPDRGPARRGRGLRGPHRHREAGDGRAGQPRREGAGRGRRARPRSSSPPAPTGASPAARCAWR